MAIESVGAVLIFGYVAAACRILLMRRADIGAARLLVAEGALLGLSFKVGATLLRTIQLHTWTEIATFAAVLAMRTLLKMLFAAERRRPATGP
ncbi:MAG: DUF1622 domain-containing protein [Candidatus Eremiobacteraeota bacterium]|nr:DUF1622 domain-containing protein [Candidatus Eremiobacteraeota bacterium]MBC5827563.1 DUF1622 domain-containing protein [Candidatus Eremiobacteraeota bacterium]